MNDQTPSEAEIRQRLGRSVASTGRFFVLNSETIQPQRQFAELLADPAVSKEIDPVALCEFPGHYAFFGSRTILKGVKRTDLSCEDNTENIALQTVSPTHGVRVASSEQIAEEFVERVLQETHERVAGCTRVGLLLSGGMDSRVVAASLRQLQKIAPELQVTCFTWGQPGTRDPVYAEKIARAYGWDFEHFNLDATKLWNNVVEAGKNGCFYSAIHLHAMPSVASRAAELGMQVMVAGSYGDSIGRAEYSRRHVSSLPPIEGRMRNWYGLLKEDWYEKCRDESLQEILRCRQLYGKASDMRIAELDRQWHYMRNMLGSAMGVIDARVPLAQAFTSRRVVEFMWSLSPECRTDEIYLHVLRRLDPQLLEIPWARTGKPYLRDDADPDALKAGFHEYASWARQNVDKLDQSIFSGALQSTGVFNMRATSEIFWAFRKYPFIQSGRIIEIVLWLASLGLLLDRLNPPPINVNRVQAGFRIRGRAQLIGTVAKQYYVFGSKLRKLR